MKREQRLQPIVRLEARREQVSVDELNLVQREREVLLEQLEQLTTYRLDYRERYLNAGRSCRFASSLRDLKVFLDSLDQAIAQLETQIRGNAARLAAARRSWLQRRARTKAVSAVVDQAITDSRAVVSRVEQNEVDDLPKAPRGLR